MQADDGRVRSGAGKINWRDVRHCFRAWLHVRSELMGEGDTAFCLICRLSVPLEVYGRSRESVLREFTRKHYYKHRIWKEDWAVEYVSPKAPDSVPLFA
jgi:hypothetical protein